MAAAPRRSIETIFRVRPRPWERFFPRALLSAQATDGYVRIADPNSAESLADNMIGEIRVSGPRLSPGYWGRSEIGKELCTSDLGAVVDGEL
ncbi:MAG: hypothetical protein U5O16_18040 [Rhodococcus sp. (in: high G+C Gram-positive bacteria)]|uniref:hypothetical protein n=1 Tax=Rhodococcus sp. TaxID=1831 RepID=UPI002ADA4C64|nr:hypothetical protein [Rhodococcus sp. (in: high G+C Gram-positive bacteria)]